MMHLQLDRCCHHLASAFRGSFLFPVVVLSLLARSVYVRIENHEACPAYQNTPILLIYFIIIPKYILLQVFVCVCIYMFPS
jgi:hypothetical protein